MKKLLFCCLSLFVAATGSLKAQDNLQDSRGLILQNNQNSSYICDSLFDHYTGNWLVWWSYALKIKNSIPGRVAPAHFTMPYKDLLLLDSLGHKGQLPDSLEAFFAFTSRGNYKSSQLTAIFKMNTAPASFKEYTDRWKTWSENHIEGPQPVGFKIPRAALDALFQLLNDRENPVKSVTGYFAFHSVKDMQSNRMVVIFRPVFKNGQHRVNNHKINCSHAGHPDRNMNKANAASFININFTNPCPPCDN